jgi:HPt (histidine-containing phosphotransfer) domain-containing protein
MSTPEPTPLPLFDDSVIAELRDVMADEFAGLIKLFLRDLPLQVAAIQTAIQQSDANTLHRTAHKLKSGSGSLGALRLSALARQLEMHGRNADLAAAAGLLAPFSQIVELTRTRFQTLLDG